MRKSRLDNLDRIPDGHIFLMSGANGGAEREFRVKKVYDEEGELEDFKLYVRSTTVRKKRNKWHPFNHGGKDPRGRVLAILTEYLKSGELG